MTLYIHVETVARELDGKLLLALQASHRGYNVVLGNRSLMSNVMHRFEPGIFLAHNFNHKRRRFLRILRQLGHQIVGLDEEGLVWLDEDSYLYRRVSPQSLGCLDTIFAWGQEHAGVLTPIASQQGVEVIPTGNPRTDLLRAPLREIYRSGAEKLQNKFGNFILINSNFGVLNFALTQGNGDGVKTEAELRDLARNFRFPEGFFKFRYAVYRAFVEMLPALSESFPDRQIIIRPHPSENPSAWKTAAKGLGNIQVHYDNELIPWLMAADAVIHNGCTTALETAVLGHPAIMYRPVEGGEFEIRQPLRVSILADDKNALFEAIANSRSNNERIEIELAKLVSGLQGQSSSELIIDAIVALQRPRPAHPIARMIGKTQSLWRAGDRTLRRLSKTSLANSSYVDHKFPPISAEDISTKIEDFANRLNIPVPQVSEISDRIFNIRK